MKKTLILAAFGLFASLAGPAFASDSPGTAIDTQGITKLNPLTAAKESPITFVIAESVDKVKERPGIAFAAKSTDSSTFIGTKGDYLLTAYDSALAGPGVITAASLDAKSIYALAKFSADPCWPPAPVKSASAQDTATIGAGGSNVTT